MDTESNCNKCVREFKKMYEVPLTNETCIPINRQTLGCNTCLTGVYEKEKRDSWSGRGLDHNI